MALLTVPAKNLLPSADEAMAYHEPTKELYCGSLLETQAAPELVEVKQFQLKPTAISLPPSAEAAMADQVLLGALVWIQVWAQAESSAASTPPQASKTNRKIFEFIRPFADASVFMSRWLLSTRQTSANSRSRFLSKIPKGC